jgi:hypothetical protein
LDAEGTTFVLTLVNNFVSAIHIPVQFQGLQFSSQLELEVKHKTVEDFAVAFVLLLLGCFEYKSEEIMNGDD